MGASRVFTASMVSGDSIVSYFNLTKGWDTCYLECPSMTSSTAIDLYAASTFTAFYQVRHSTVQPQVNITQTMASAGTTAIINAGAAYTKMYLQVGSFNSSANLTIAAAPDGTNYYDMRVVSPSTGVVQTTFVIAASASANGCLVALPIESQYVKITADSAPSIAVGFKLVCIDEAPQLVSFTIAASTVANGGLIPIPAGFTYYKLLATDSAPTANTTFNIVCVDD